MKKILAVSLGALLVATAANADIASVDYVTGALAGKQDASTIGTVNAANMGTTATTVVTAINEVAGEAAAAQSTANTAVTNAAAAQSTANTASTNATTANNAIAAMDLAAVGGTTSVIRSVAQTNGKVTATAEAVDTTPTASSAKLITSGGVFTALGGKQDASTIGTVTAAAMGTTATTVVTAIKEVAGEAADAQSAADTAYTTANSALTNAAIANNAIAGMTLGATGGDGKVIRSVSQTNGKVTASAEAVDTTPTSASTKLITSGGVYSGLAKKVNIKQGTENAGKGLLVDGTDGALKLADIATQEELDRVARTAASGQTATQVNTAITNAIGGLDVASVGGAGQFVITIKQENGLIDAGVKSFVPSLSDGELDAPTTDAVYDALQGKLSTALGSGAASKAVITDTSGNITTGTISSAMITDGTIATGDIADSAVTSAKIGANAVTGAKISDGTITNADISGSAAIAQSKISGLATSLAGKQQVVSDGEEGKFYVADSGSGWKDMFDAMPKNEYCEREGVKCSLTHKSGKYYWEIVRE